MKEKLTLSGSAVYEIRVQGHLDEHWAGWFTGFTLASDPVQQVTTLTGLVPDQAVLHGILTRIRDLGLPLLSMTCVSLANEK